MSPKPKSFPPIVPLPISLRFLRSLPLPHKLGLLERIFGKSLSQYGVCFVDVSNGICWQLDLTDSCQRWIVYGDYEGPNQMAWLKGWLSKGGNVVDSGANIGQMLLNLAPLSNVSIFAFEPLPFAADWLNRCLVNYPEWRVEVFRLGLSDHHGEISVQVDGPRTTARMDWYVDKALTRLTIPVTILDDFLKSRAIEKLKLWKLDIEGHELEALKGAEWYLRNHRIDAVLFEVTGTKAVNFLSDCGYSIYWIGKKGYLNEFEASDQYHGNLLALPRAVGFIDG